MSYRRLLPTFAQSDEFSPAEREVLRAIGNNSYHPPSIEPPRAKQDSTYTTADVCEVLKICRSQFYARNLHKQFTTVDGATKSHPRYSAEDVQRWMAQNRVRIGENAEVTHAS